MPGETAKAFFRTISVPEHETISFLGIDRKGAIASIRPPSTTLQGGAQVDRAGRGVKEVGQGTGREAACKDSHIRTCLEHDVESSAATGLEALSLSGGLPGFSVSDIDTTAQFLGKTLALPLLIAPITGGGSLSLEINRNLATAASRCGIAMAVGSQRPMMEKSAAPESYLVREWAPGIPLLANLSLLHARNGRDYLIEAVESIKADGIIL